MKPYIFGVDLGGTTVKIGLFENDPAADAEARHQPR